MDDLSRPERRKDINSQLLRTLQEQNAMLEQLVSFMCPVSDFFKALRLIVRAVSWVAAAVAIAWGSIQAIKEYVKTHQ